MQFNYCVFGVFLAVYVLQTCLDLWMERLNLRYASQLGDKVPRPFEGLINEKQLAEMRSYNVDKTRVRVSQQLASDLVLLTLILSGFPVFLEGMFMKWGVPFYPAGLLFFVVPGLVLYAIGLPFSYYQTFVIEERFGFNRSTVRIWVLDHLKSGLLGVVLFAILLFLILWLIRIFPAEWWLWGFAIVSCVQSLLGILYPVIIAPIFNKFEPVQDELLAKKLTRLVEENGIKVKRILQMNAGIRSRHSNAYFTGLGRTKQIVLFDTLIESHSHDEILSILAHEVGHFKRKHITKQLLLFEVTMLVAFYLTALLMSWHSLYSAFGFTQPQAYVGLFFIGIIWQKASFFVQPFFMAVSRRFEREADLYASRLVETPRPLIAALKRMAKENLSNLTPHPLYVLFNYSHPPLIERIALLEDVELECDLSSGRPDGYTNAGGLN